MMRVAVIGVGAFGREHAAVYARLPSVELAGVVDTNPETARRAAQDFGAAAFTSVAALLAAAQVDAVSVAVPAEHRAEVLAELERMPMLIEKPLAATPAEADAWASRWAGEPVMVGHLLRFAEPYRRIARELARREPDGQRPRLARIRPADHYDRYPAEDVIGLTMVHDLDALPWLAGAAPRCLTARGAKGADGRWADVRAEIALDNGETWQVDAAWTGPHRDVVSARGCGLTLGSQTGELRRGDDVEPLPGADASYDAALVAEIGHFLDCVIHDRPSTELRLADAAAAVRLAAAVREALTTGESVDCH